MKTVFTDNNSDELIFLLNGWGMDERPYKTIKNGRDILFISDYSDLNLDLPKNFDYSKYKKITLITFSAGAFMAKYLKTKFPNMLPNFDLKIALSGNFHIFEPDKGIDKNSLSEMKNITLENALAFRYKLVDTEKEYKHFNQNQPLRTLESSLNELSALEKYSKELKNLENKNQIFEFDKVIVGKNDKIIPYENQLNAWNDVKNIKTIDGGHFLFYRFDDFDEILNF